MSQKKDTNSYAASAITQKNDQTSKKMKVVDYLITSLPSQMNLTFDTNTMKIGNTIFTINGRLLIPKVDVLNGKLVDSECKYKWNTTAPHPIKKPERLMIPYLSGAIGIARHVETELAAFNIYFTENMLQTILIHTNETIKVSQCYIFPKNNYGYPLSLTELKAFIGILYFSAAKKYTRMNSLHPCGFDIFNTVMSEERFEHLIRCLSFDKYITRKKKMHSDSLSGIKDIWTEFITKCSEVFRPSSSCVIDELLVDFIGSGNNELTLPKTSEKCMIKLIILCDSKNQYFISGSLHIKSNSGSEISEYEIEKITKPIHGTNINITYSTDWLTSVALSKKMLKQYKLRTVALLHKNHSEIPEDIILTENRPVGTSIFLYNNVDELQICTYYSMKGEIEVLLSNIHFESAIEEPEGYPKIVEYYNSTRNEIHAIKRVYYKYSCSRPTSEWFLSIFYSILDLASINSLAIFNSNRSRCGKPSVHHVDFLYKLSIDLMLPYLYEHLMNVNTSDSVRYRIRNMIEERQKLNMTCTPKYNAQQSKVTGPLLESQKVMKPIGSERDAARNHSSPSTVNKVQETNHSKRSIDSSTSNPHNQFGAVGLLHSVNNNIVQAAPENLSNYKTPYFNSFGQLFPGIVVQSVIPRLDIECSLSNYILQIIQALHISNIDYNQCVFPFMINPYSSILPMQQLHSMFPAIQAPQTIQPFNPIMHMLEKSQKTNDSCKQLYKDNTQYNLPQPKVLPIPSSLLMTTYPKTKPIQSIAESRQVLSVCGICSSIGDKKYYIECFKCSVLLCTVHRKILCTFCYSSKQSTALNAYIHASKKSKCGVCGPKKLLKYSIQCSKCGTFLCLEHRRILCCFCYDM